MSTLLSKEVEDKEEAESIWIENHGELLKSKLNESIKETANMLFLDMKDTSVTEEDDMIQRQLRYVILNVSLDTKYLPD